ncbi:hypothetical protein [Kordia sp.]|uniref:hypothetical protein n=1 Tax=Kordia sp. TaxID=1965332 RepID=UPI003D6A33ED
MKKLTLILMLLGLTCTLNAQSNYGKGRYTVKFETAIGCLGEIQSNNLKFTKEKLNQIIPLLVNFPSMDKGYFNEFKPLSIFPFNKKGLTKKDYQEFAQQQFDLIKLRTKKLLNLDIPIEFESLRNAHLNNRKIKMPFYEALVEWTKDGNEKVFREKIIALCNNNTEVKALLDTIFNLPEWEEQFLKLSVEMSNLYNKINRESFISAREIEKQLFLKYDIKCLTDPECTDC